MVDGKEDREYSREDVYMYLLQEGPKDTKQIMEHFFPDSEFPERDKSRVSQALNRLRKWGRIQGIGSGPGRVMVWSVVADDTPLPDGRDGMC